MAEKIETELSINGIHDDGRSDRKMNPIYKGYEIHDARCRIMIDLRNRNKFLSAGDAIFLVGR